MIDSNLFRIRIGIFISRKLSLRIISSTLNIKRHAYSLKIQNCLILTLLLLSYALCLSLTQEDIIPLNKLPTINVNRDETSLDSAAQYLIVPSKKESPNFLARMIHGNIRKGLVNMHVNVRSLYNKIGEIIKA